MSQQIVPGRLADRLRKPDDDLVRKLADHLEKQLPRALARHFGAVPGSVDIEGALSSVDRTLWRRLRDGDDPNLDRLETLDDLFKWLFYFARLRILKQLRHAEVEARHSVALKAQHMAEEEDQDTAEWFATLLERSGAISVDDLIGSLFDILDDRERRVLVGLFLTNPPLSTKDLGKELHRTSRTVRNILAAIRAKCQSFVAPR
jgi:DNA-directed RNA polymerase specialized sigma24 family protein